MKKIVSNFVFLLLLSGLVGGVAFAQQPIPEAAQAHFRTGVSMIEQAQTPQDLRNALTEFEMAAELAPAWADIHFNLAQLAAETDKPAKAIKEYETYLALKPAATDRDKVQIEVVRLQGAIAIKRKVGLPGVTFAAMPDGIWVMQIAPGSRVAGPGFLRQGMKIVAVEETPVTGVTLEKFFRAIDAKSANSDTVDEKVDITTNAGKERIFSRIAMARSTKARNAKAAAVSYPEETGQIVKLMIISPGYDKPGKLYFKTSMFHSKVIEIEEDEFEQEVLRADQPVVVTFWADGCEPCQEFVAAVEIESARPGQQVKFVNLNTEENKALARQLAITGLPTMMTYQGGQPLATHTGNLSREEVARIISQLAATAN